MRSGSAFVAALGLLATASAAQPAESPAPPLTTVAVDVTALAGPEWAQLDALALEKRVVLRLVQDGFAVVASAANPDVRLVVTRTATGLHLVAHGRARDADADVAIGADALPELHLEIAQKSVELAHTAAPPALVVAPPLPPAPVEPPPPARPKVGLNVGGALGFVVRAGGTDPAARLVVRYGRLVGAELSIGLLGSGVSAVTVLELPVMLALSVRLELGRGFGLEAALGGGVRVHAFFFSDPAAVPAAGVRADLIGSVPVTVSFFPLPWFGIGLRFAPGVASAAQEHASGGATVWSRGQWWFEANGLAFLGF